MLVSKRFLACVFLSTFFFLPLTADRADAASSCTTACATTPYAPSKFSTLLTSGYSSSSSAKLTTGLVTRTRYMFQDATTGNYLDLGTLNSTTDRYPLVEKALSTAPTYQEYLTKLVQVVADSDGTCFRFDSHLNANYSLDVSSSVTSPSLNYSNNWGVIASGSTSPGFTCFSYSTSTKLIKIVKRYTYNAVTTGTSPSTVTSYSHSLSTTVPGSGTYYLKYSAGSSSFSLVTTTSTATQFNLYSNPFGTNLNIPQAFNPSSLAYASNSPVALTSSLLKISAGYSLYNSATASKIFSNYRDQLFDSNGMAVGTNTSTKAAAATMLDTISSTLISERSALRYPKSVYIAFRDAALSYIQKSGDVVDGVVGQNTVPFVWFTNETDGTYHHPFMIISSYSVVDGPMGLLDVATPPGSGTCTSSSGACGYPQQTVTRSGALQNYLYRIPLRDYGIVTNLTDNTMGTSSAKSLLSDSGMSGTNTFENYASISENGVLINGVSAYPILSNTLQSCAAGASITAQGCHVGQGMGLHCHSDGFQANTSSNMNLYHVSDYVGKDHPPLIGFGFDGVAIFGAYLSNYSSMAGYTPSTCNAPPAASTSVPPTACLSTYKLYALDAWGGHTHYIDGSSVYHYHAHPYSSTTLAVTGSTSVPYTNYAYITGAWRGRINSIPGFWDNSGKPETGRTSPYSGLN